MKNKILYTGAIALMMVLVAFDRAELFFLDRLKEQLSRFTANHPEEKVYLQVDKPFYAPGEDIWFNAYLLDASTHKPSRFSDVVYVELKDPKGNNVSKLELFVKDGATRGDLNLTTDAPGGIYTLTAYTQWMRNAGEETFFKKEIQVQHIVTPRLLVKLDFAKEAYGRGDEVVANLTVTSLKNEPASSASIRATVKLDGNAGHTFETTTDGEGKATLKFMLPDTLSSTDGLLQAIIDFNGQNESISRSVPIVLDQITLQFFPEGGEMVADAPAHVAFQATNEFGKGADVTGFVLDESGVVVSGFESFHMGMGSFHFTPQAGKKYFARIAKPAGNNTPVALPEAIDEGFAMEIKKQNHNELTCQVYTPSATHAFLVGQAHGVIYYAEKVALQKGTNHVVIGTTAFPAGIAMFTLFDAEGWEACERLVFLNSYKTLKVSLRTDREEYEPRDKVTVRVETTDDQGKPVPARLSLAVVDDQVISFADDKQDNILSWMLLSSELRGKIQEPSFYFDPKEPKAGQALDYLMLTHGWRRFTWKEVMANDRAIVYAPENSSTLSGTTLDKNNDASQAEVVLLELGNRRRIAKVKSTQTGQFSFKNIDASVPLLLLTRKPHQLQVDVSKLQIKKEIASSPPPFQREELEVALAEPMVADAPQEVLAQGAPVEMDMAMMEDATQLSEVVVTALGVQERKYITGSVVAVQSTTIENVQAMPAVENLFQGRVAGLHVIQPNINPGTVSTIRIRGAASQASRRGEPLLVIDGHPVSGSLNQNFSNGSILGPEQIKSIEVLQSPEATALYGSAGANGAILITSKSQIGVGVFKPRARKEKYDAVTITPRMFSATREFYREVPSRKKSAERQDFATTVYWNDAVITDARGKASVTFYLNDATTTFRMTAEGISGGGLLGRSEETFASLLPFSLDTKVPAYLGFEDTLALPVMVRNNTQTLRRGSISLALPPALKAIDQTNATIEVGANQTKTHWIRLVPTGQQGSFSLSISLESNGFEDLSKHTVSIHPIGFPMRVSVSGKDLEKKIAFEMKDVEKGSVKGEVKIFTDILTDLFSGAEGILREPHGCFEQVSSSTFPNILALQFLKQSGQGRPDVEKLAMEYIRSGYEKLAAYEISSGGFEWFGRPPAHEALTAYGLIEFHEMKKVYKGVNDAMIERTRRWLLSRRAGDGTFHVQRHGLDDFAKPSGDVTNAYIVYALSETGTKDIETEYEYTRKEAWKSSDMYRLALLANCAFNLGKEADYRELVDHLSKHMRRAGADSLHADHSVVWSQGRSLETETQALWAIALMKAPEKDMVLINKLIRAISAKRSFGMFGSTQATILSLKALTEFARYMSTSRQPGEVVLAVNDKQAGALAYTSTTRDDLALSGFAPLLNNGRNLVALTFTNTSEALPYSLDIAWNAKTPASNKDCKVRIKTTLARNHMRVNETVRLSTILQNTSAKGVPMTMALVGIPAGLSLQPWQLKELKEKGVFDFYEIIGDRLAIYYRQLGPLETRTINLDLKADVPGTFTGVASTAYLYYTDEHKHWVSGNRITIDN